MEGPREHVADLVREIKAIEGALTHEILIDRIGRSAAIALLGFPVLLFANLLVPSEVDMGRLNRVAIAMGTLAALVTGGYVFYVKRLRKTAIGDLTNALIILEEKREVRLAGSCPTSGYAGFTTDSICIARSANGERRPSALFVMPGGSR